MINTRRNFKAVLTVVALGLPVVGVGATFEVNSPVDAVDADLSDGLCLTADSVCSLRAAVQQANEDTSTADVISISPGTYKLTLPGDNGENDPLSGDLDVKGNVTIVARDGPGTVNIDGNSASRIFEVWGGGGSVLFDGLTIQNGGSPNNSENGIGGGIRVREFVVLTIQNSRLSYNQSFADGGAIYANLATLTIENSVISRNKTSSFGAGIAVNDTALTIRNTLISDNDGIFSPPGVINGGGIAVFNGTANVLIENSAIVGNEVSNAGGGIYMATGQLVMINSTVSDNTSNLSGGGIYYRSSASSALYNSKLINVTLARNDARGIYNQKPQPGAGGGGLFVEAQADIDLVNTLIVENGGGDCIVSDLVRSLGNNMDSDGTCGLDQAGDLPAQGLGHIGALADNGGPTETHALLAGSVAIDAANDAVCNAPDQGNSMDQRHYLRPASGCDIGAFEFDAVAGSETPLPGTATPPAPPEGHQPPLAFGLPYTVAAGGELNGVYNAASNVMPLTFEIVQGPTKGQVSEPGTGVIPEAFTYVAAPDASGSDSIRYRACDKFDVCSEEAIISILITSEPAAYSVRMDIVNDEGGTVTNPTGVQIVAQSDLDVVAPDIDFDYPLGAMFFTLDNIPTDPAPDSGVAQVLLQLPTDADIPADAVVRKMDKTGIWRTLESEAAPGSLTYTAVIDRVAKTITLTLYDNDILFDRNPAVGVIDDPVALAVPVSRAQGAATVESETAAAPTDGGGSLSWYLLFALLPLWMRRRNIH